jgi:hypothetical protein
LARVRLHAGIDFAAYSGLDQRHISRLASEPVGTIQPDWVGQENYRTPTQAGGDAALYVIYFVRSADKPVLD